MSLIASENVDLTDRIFLARIEALLAAFSGRWTIRILVALLQGPMRTTELCRAVPDARKKMVIDSLHRLEKAGVIERRDLSGVLKHVEYALLERTRDQISALIRAVSVVDRQDVMAKSTDE